VFFVLTILALMNCGLGRPDGLVPLIAPEYTAPSTKSDYLVPREFQLAYRFALRIP